MAKFEIRADWLVGGTGDATDDFVEAATMADVSIAVGEQPLSTVYDPDSGETNSGARLPTVVLAEGLIRCWWPLLYEPQRTLERQPRRDERFEARHRLDSMTPGYVFPPIGIWSGGETIMVGLFRPDTRFHRKIFQLPDQPSWSLARGDVEHALGNFVQATIEQAGKGNGRAAQLRDGWETIVASIHDPEEKEWCTNAGRLGLDPYDPGTIDLGRISAGISEALFGDICEASEPEELARTCEWVKAATAKFRAAKSISVKDFGGAPYRDLTQPGWKNGYEGVQLLRNRLGLPLDPQQSLAKIFDGADKADAERLQDYNPSAVEGLARRQGSEIRIAVPARSTRQQRFRMCRATYLAWRAGPEADVAATPAETWRQQASRAFAAELLAPSDLLKQRFGRSGLNARSIERLADEWQCPPRTIAHQAQNNKVPVTGVETAAYF